MHYDFDRPEACECEALRKEVAFLRESLGAVTDAMVRGRDASGHVYCGKCFVCDWLDKWSAIRKEAK